MNAKRHFVSRLSICACVAAALVAAPALGQLADPSPTRSFSRDVPRGPASKTKSKGGAGHQHQVRQETEELFESPPRSVPRRTARPSSYLPVSGRVPQGGTAPRKNRVMGAQFEEPVPENLPAPMPPTGMGVAPGAESAEAEPVPERAPAGGHRVLKGAPRSGPTMMMESEFEGEVPFGGSPFEGNTSGGGCSSCGEGGCSDGGCGGGIDGYYRDCFPCLFLSKQNLDIFSGVQAFTNSTNRSGAGSFGYHLGFNKGRPLQCFPCTNLAMQFGLAGNFSNLDGATFNNNGALAATPDSRNQMFMTWGLFRRVDWGLQFGMVFDFLHDDWYVNMDVGQLRGEISWVYPEQHEIGFWFAAGVNPGNDVGQVLVAGAPVPVTDAWEAADLYAFFYRSRFAGGGQGRCFGGFTGDGDGLIGSDIRLPINNNWSFQADYTYLIPKTNGGTFANTNANEAWNLAFNLVWSPGMCRNPGQVNYNDPLFNVANNGSLILKRRP